MRPRHPERGAFHTRKEYRSQRVDVASIDPPGVALALPGDRWVGMMVLSRHPQHALVEMTGVVRDRHRKGVSSATKAVGLRYAAEQGVRRVKTFHHPADAAAIEANRRLGFVDDS